MRVGKSSKIKTKGKNDLSKNNFMPNIFSRTYSPIKAVLEGDAS